MDVDNGYLAQSDGETEDDDDSRAVSSQVRMPGGLRKARLSRTLGTGYNESLGDESQSDTDDEDINVLITQMPFAARDVVDDAQEVS